jgi:hypothetical protein
MSRPHPHNTASGANGGRTPARIELAAVIARRAQAAQELADTQNAISGAKRLVADAASALDQALSDLDRVKQQAAQRTAHALTTGGTPPEPDNSLREACIRQLDAETRLEAAKVTLAQLEASIEGCQYIVAQADKQAAAAALAVIAAEVDKPRLIEDLHAAHARWGALHAQLYWMLQHDLTHDFDPNSAYPNHVDRMRRDGPSAEALRATWNLDGFYQDKQRAKWDEYVAALARDAGAPLPAA